MIHNLADSNELRTNAEAGEDFNMLFLLYQHKESTWLSLACCEVVVSQVVFLLHLLNHVTLLFCHNIFSLQS